MFESIKTHSVAEYKGRAGASKRHLIEVTQKGLLVVPALFSYAATLPLVLLFLCKPGAVGCRSFEEEWECEG